jgi:BirA family biotin operon repressor/biotin-[acetyl-CoA-carboxylase] ligase
MNQTTLQLDDILNKILASFDAWYILMNKDGFTPIRSAWLSRARKGTLRVRLPADEGEVNGEFVDLDDEGSLCLSLQDGTERRIVAGDVFS